VGLLHDISSVITKEKINIKSISSQKNNRRVTLYISLGNCKNKQEEVLEKIKKIKNIKKIICREKISG
jgi:ACT domain-containing protein